MADFTVRVSYTKRYEKELSIFAKDEQHAEEKAVDIVQRWDGVVDVEVTDIAREG
jgi:hypothetical protein